MLASPLSLGVVAVLLHVPAPVSLARVADPIAPAQAPAAVANDAPLAREQVEDLMRATVCAVSLRYPKRETRSNVEDVLVRRVQPGFVASAAGLIVTSYAAVHAAESIAVEFPGGMAGRTRVPADVVAIDELHDLVLLRAQRAPTAPASAGNDAPAAEVQPTPARFVATQSAAVPPGSSTWTPVLSPDGKSLELVESSELLDSDEAGVRMRSSRYESRLGGQPVLDASGRLAGVWCWQAPGTKSAPSWIGARVVHEFVARNASAPVLKRADRRARAPRVSRAMPELLFEGRSKSSPMDDVTKRTNNLREQTACPSCRGFGWILDAEFAETQRGVDIRKVDKSKLVVCRGCKGARLRDRGAIWEAMRTLAKWYAQVDPRNARDVERSLQQLEKGIGEAAQTNAAVLIERLNDGSKEELNRANLVPGRALVLAVHRDEWLAATVRRNADQRRFDDVSAIGLIGTTDTWEMDARVLNTREFGPLLLVGPATRSVIGEGHRALVVGVVAGLVTIDEQPVVRLDGCFVVPIRETSDDPGR